MITDNKRPVAGHDLLATPGAERYRAAERRLWHVYGITPTERVLELDSPAVRVRVTEVGEGKPVICLGGTGGTGPYFGGLVRPDVGLRWIIVDRPGFGLSDPVNWARGDFTDTMVNWQFGVLNALGLDRVAMVGASVGGLFAVRLALAHPDRVDRLCLLGASPVRAQVVPTRFLQLLRTPIGAIIVRVPARRKMLENILTQIGHGDTVAAGGIPEAYWDWRISFENDLGAMRHERKLVQAVLDRSGIRSELVVSDDEARTLRAPVLMVYGTNDVIGPRETFERLTELAPDGKFRLLHGGGHIPWLDDPDRVASWVYPFLAA